MKGSDKSGRRPRLRFNLKAMFVLVTVAAVYAWTWRAGQGPLASMLLTTGAILYWRIGIRRHDPFSRFDILALGLPAALFLWCLVIFAIWLVAGPKIRYDLPVTEQKQGVIRERAK